ncbi:MAG: rane protein of unknown function [Candidatus Saccharibacteria bacterium]|nr:rane protein of unknown function [Candidatus Saccharibacteria bacterium]
MKIKQIKTFLLAVTLILSTLVGTISISGTALAYTCPAGQEFHASDNACWTKTDAGAAVKCTSTSATGCESGNAYKCSGSSYTAVGDKCYTFARSNTPPAYEDGSAATFSCPSGQEYHSSDNKCWKAETVAKINGGRVCPGGSDAVGTTCVKYTETTDNPVISRDYKAEYCGSNFPQETDACKAGQKNTDCSTYTDATQKNACAEGVATTLCGVNSGGGTSNSADARQQCYNDVKNCMTSDKPIAEQKQCASQVAGVDPTQAQKISPTDPGGTGTNCGDAETVLISCKGTGVQAIGDVLRIAISVLTVIIGVAAVGGIAWAAVIYAKAEDNASEVSEARTLIRNIVIGLLLYGFLVGIINWLVPGNVFG